MGNLTFEELYHQTHRIVGALLRDRLGMTNPDDIDDCLQAAYLKIWQRLEKNSALFADKPKRYIVQALLFATKVQRFSHQRYYRKLVYDAQPEQQFDVSHLTTQQVETWIDLERAIQRVAEHVLDTPMLLWGLYCLITQTTTRDAATLFGWGHSTLRAQQRRVRATLMQTLPGYGRPYDSQYALPLPVRNRHTQPLPSKCPLLTTQLFQSVFSAPPQTKAPSKSHTGNQGEHHAASPRPSLPSEYPTRWGGRLTLEAILTDPQVRRAAWAKIHQIGLSDADGEDCLQQGSLKLWQTLTKNSLLLADKGAVWTGIYLVYSGNTRQFLKYHQRTQHFDKQAFDWQDAQEYLVLGQRERQRHADWTQQVEEVIDAERFMRMMAQHYQDDVRSLLALYAYTTSVKVKDVAAVLGMHEKNFAASIGNRVKAEMRTVYHQMTTPAPPASSD